MSKLRDLLEVLNELRSSLTNPPAGSHHDEEKEEKKDRGYTVANTYTVLYTYFGFFF